MPDYLLIVMDVIQEKLSSATSLEVAGDLQGE